VQFRFSKHTQERLQGRGIAPELLRRVLETPEQKVPGARGTVVYQSRFEQEGQTFLLRVAVNENADPAVVTTVYFTSKVEKYWKGKP